MDLPRVFPLWREDGEYNTEELQTGSASRQKLSVGALTNAMKVTALDTISPWLWQSDKVLWLWRARYE